MEDAECAFGLITSPTNGDREMNIKELKAVAEAATPSIPDRERLLELEAFKELCDPATILKLIAVVEALKYQEDICEEVSLALKELDHD